MVDAGTRVLKGYSAELGPRLAQLFDPTGTLVPKAAARWVAKAAKSIEFSQGPATSLMSMAVTILAVYGERDRAAEVARLFAQVPDTGNRTVFEPLRSSIAVAAWFQVDAVLVAELQSLSVVGWNPNPRRVKGVMLREPRHQSAEERAKFAGHPVWYFAGEFLADIEELAAMAALGGSFTWSRRKIAAEINANLAALFALPGFEPVAV